MNEKVGYKNTQLNSILSKKPSNNFLTAPGRSHAHPKGGNEGYGEQLSINP